MWCRVGAMLRKEFNQLLHDYWILFILVYAFTGAIYVAGHAISMEIKNYPIAVLDLSQSRESRDLVGLLQPPYFKLVTYARSDAALVKLLDGGKVSLGLVIPPDFSREVRENRGKCQVISDGTLSMAATIAMAHVAQIAADYGIKMLEQQGQLTKSMLSQIPQVDARVRVAYNPNISSSWFTTLLELMNIITMISMLLSASAMVREKVYGTIEQLQVSPLRPAELFAAKIIPTTVVILLLSILSLFGVIKGVFNVPLQGNLFLFFSVTAIYIFSIASLGMAIAVIAKNIAQVAMMLLMIMYPMLFLSGAFTPPESMATWMRWTSLLSPMRYYMDFGFQVLYKGNGLAEVWYDIVGIVIIGSCLFAFSVWRFGRSIR